MWEFAMQHPIIFLQIVFWVSCFTCATFVSIASIFTSNKTNTNLVNVEKRTKENDKIE